MKLGDRTCAFPSCGRRFESKRADARFCSDKCRYDDWDAKHPRRGRESRTTDGSHPLAEVTEAQEQHKAHWSTAIYAEIVRILQVRGEFHADDLEPMGIPEDCGAVKSAQVGAVVHKGLMVERGRRPSTVPSNHRRKSGVYKPTAKLNEIAEVGAGNGDRVGGGSHSQAAGTDRASADLDDSAALLPADFGRAKPVSALTSPEAA